MYKFKRFLPAIALLACATQAFAAGKGTTVLAGRWDAALNDQGTLIPFRIDLSGTDGDLRATLYDGFKPYDGSTGGSYRDGNLVIDIGHYLTKITAQLHGNRLEGNVSARGRGLASSYGFTATRHVATPRNTGAVPDIAGNWEIPLSKTSSKGEKAFRLVVQQDGADVSASVLRVDGDTGAYAGTWSDGKWVLSHFDGSRPGLVELTPAADGTLKIRAHTDTNIRHLLGDTYADDAKPGTYDIESTAYRPEVARAKGLPEPADFLKHTTARDPNEKFSFHFKDDHGNLVSSDDPQFRDKVVLAIVTGTWCPNCHDEAQYLVQLDAKYRDRGLEIVALDFEEPEQLDGLQREHDFVKKYGVKYTYLIAGAPEEMWEKVPQLVNLNTWPATIFVGRDGRVRAVHAGFASPASGDYHEQLKREFTERIEQLLAERPSATAANDSQSVQAGLAANLPASTTAGNP